MSHTSNSSHRDRARADRPARVRHQAPRATDQEPPVRQRARVMGHPKTAATDHATGISLTGHAWASEHDRTEKICVLDLGRADRC